MIKFIIILGSLKNNRGSEALVRGLTSIIKKANNDVDITVISSEFDVKNKKKVPNVDRILCRYSYKSKRSIKRYLAAFFEKILHIKEIGSNIRYYHLKKMVSCADHIIVIGADNYDATYHLLNWLHQMNLFLRKNTKGKLWLYDCSLEKNHLNDKVINDMLLFDGITVRETETEETLKSAPLSKNIYMFPDPAFTMMPEEYVGISDIESAGYIGINLSNLIIMPQYTNSKEIVFENYRNLINYCLDVLHNKVLLIPHVMDNADLSVLREIKNFFIDDDRVVLLEDEEINSAQLKYVISKCRFFIAARTHASIAAYSSCIPTLVLGYSVKSRGIAKDLFGDVDHFVVPIQKMKREDTLVNSFKWIVQHENEITKRLETVIPDYIEKAGGVVALFNRRQLVEKQEECCGCKACSNICPKKCISFEMDTTGFIYPMVDKSTCIDCNLCIKVCPLKHYFEIKENKLKNHLYFAAYNKDRDMLLKSSSGGIFGLLAKYIISNGGIVYGAKVKNRFYVYHDRAVSLEEAEGFFGSKYLHSDINDCYHNCKIDLEDGRKVLFSGTPCQIAGLYTYLQRDYSNLVTVGVVCHGVPSRTIFDKFIVEVEKKHRSEVTKYQWRNKEKGWGPNHVRMDYSNGTHELTVSVKNPYTKGFLKNCYIRPSCYQCKFAKLPRIEDLAISDFWGYEGRLTETNHNEGLSMVVVTNSKGLELFNNIKEELVFESVTEEYAKSKSRHLWLHPHNNLDKAKIAKTAQYMTFTRINKKYINKSIIGKIFNRLKILFRIREYNS